MNKQIMLKNTLLLLITIFLSCKKESYQYTNGLQMYMKEVHAINLNDIKENILYILPISDCSSCQSTSLNLELLRSAIVDTTKVTIILTGTPNSKIYKKEIDQLISSFTVVKDIKDKINIYQTGVSKPMLIHIKKGKVAYHLSITDFKIEAAREYLNKL